MHVLVGTCFKVGTRFEVRKHFEVIPLLFILGTAESDPSTHITKEETSGRAF